MRRRVYNYRKKICRKSLLYRSRICMEINQKNKKRSYFVFIALTVLTALI
jgi:hypothetical protein